MQRMTQCIPPIFMLLIVSLCAVSLSAQERATTESRERRQPKAESAPSDANSWYEQARRHTARGNLEQAIVAYEKFLQQADIQKDAQERLLALRQQLEQKHLNEKLEQKYTAGKAALNARDWPRAALEFEILVQHRPGFRDTEKRLLEAQTKLASENRESMAVRFYALGVSALAWNEIDVAQLAFSNVQRLVPNYRDTQARLERLESMRTQATSGHASAARIDSLAQFAQDAANTSDWLQAVIALEALRLVRPEDNTINERLSEARTALALSQTATPNAEATAPGIAFSYLGGFALLLALPAFGWLYFAPAARARRLLLRNDYRSAAKVYETELARHPSRVKYFSKLAEIYLLEGRKDDEAMKIYRNVLQLNLAANHREEINAVVAQQYLQEGRTDSDAIEVLEKQLEAELHRQSRALVKAG